MGKTDLNLYHKQIQNHNQKPRKNPEVLGVGAKFEKCFLRVTCHKHLGSTWLWAQPASASSGLLSLLGAVRQHGQGWERLLMVSGRGLPLVPFKNNFHGEKKQKLKIATC